MGTCPTLNYTHGKAVTLPKSGCGPSTLLVQQLGGEVLAGYHTEPPSHRLLDVICCRHESPLPAGSDNPYYVKFASPRCPRRISRSPNAVNLDSYGI